ncbi:hypothetical protein [Pectobacterium parmentieri]|uniref:Uncharacterized protein n=1 Tax=Pectobacterium parmentieri TaxID=1905730 RepID=A0A8B3FA54_PECPM|nr:hypothetical protein [Pectobacterium parmentieri]AOR58556.1 hypothetical protein A8F97_06505 [Pectobacterium parmentieri]AYH10442.1 hypothetical protein C5E24_12480 [Pectobacterium parmentieri]AYH18846.1 hypothetical protein C5E22_10310 [Pectobacterium parmentieri]AYH36724.1 hypothetical protein C5E17_12225 [Pectobacterium parmentieri]AZS56955.1 hypothetical protein C5E18_12915 [Pectobacterium parmentieri]
MSLKYDCFLIEKTKEIKISLLNEEPNMYELIGSIRDLFSSSYNNKLIANTEVIEELWSTLFNVFCESISYENKFDAIFSMSDIYIYSKRKNINLNLDLLKEWRGKNNLSTSTEEILECVDDILI